MNLEKQAAEIRGTLIELSCKQHIPHLASALSCVDILVAVYWGGSHEITPENIQLPTRDRFVLSKGHAAPVLYTTLAYKGILPFEELYKTSEIGASLAEQPAPFCHPGVEWATGSLGHGLGVATGMLAASRLKGIGNRATVLLGDGECNEGSVWEAAMFAAAQRLSNLTVIIDFNAWQATGRSKEIMALDPLCDKWKAFGWDAVEVDGHDIPQLREELKRNVNRRRPKAIVAHTTKGKGVDFMEDDNNWHYRIPKPEEVNEAFRQLGLQSRNRLK